MALAKWKKGTDCEFQIKLFEDDGVTPISIDNLLDIRCHLYTSTQDKKLYSKVLATGYTQLIKITEYIYKGILEGAINKNMKEGTVTLAIWTATTNVQISTGRFKSAGCGEIAVLEKISTSEEV